MMDAVKVARIIQVDYRAGDQLPLVPLTLDAGLMHVAVDGRLGGNGGHGSVLVKR